MFINLINNAVQAMNGTGRLTLGTAQDGTWIDVTIADTGPGIPAAVREKIFDPFFTTKPPGKGTGLGLSIVHKIVTRHGGTVAVDSLEGKGPPSDCDSRHYPRTRLPRNRSPYRHPSLSMTHTQSSEAAQRVHGEREGDEGVLLRLVDATQRNRRV
ncbi:MAG: ATP-binding protein [Nitrospira sp.]|nr:ATP-binding protein [Nitrospira sp.]